MYCILINTISYMGESGEKKGVSIISFVITIVFFLNE